MATERHFFDPKHHDEANQTLHAIRQGEVDAFVVEEAEGHRVYALANADLPHSLLVERMQQGAAMLADSGEFLSCNPALAALLNTAGEQIIGKKLSEFLSEEDWRTCAKLLANVSVTPAEIEVQLRRSGGSAMPSRLSFLKLTSDKSVAGMLVTDLTAAKQVEESSVALQRMQDEERRNISRELHDSVGQSLAALSMNLNSILSETHKISPAAARAAEDSAGLVAAITNEIRTISYLLHPPLLELAGLAAAVRWYVDGFSERSKMPVNIEIAPDLPKLPAEAELAIYRMVQECLTNVHRHSGSDSCSLKIVHHPGRLQIEIRDTGRGIPKEKMAPMASSGVGLRGMRERLRQLGGTLELRSDDHGTTVMASLPVSDTAKADNL